MSFFFKFQRIRNVSSSDWRNWFEWFSYLNCSLIPVIDIFTSTRLKKCTKNNFRIFWNFFWNQSKTWTKSYEQLFGFQLYINISLKSRKKCKTKWSSNVKIPGIIGHHPNFYTLSVVNVRRCYRVFHTISQYALIIVAQSLYSVCLLTLITTDLCPVNLAKNVLEITSFVS